MSEYVRNISERLVKKHDVTVFASNPEGTLPRYEVINGVKVFRYNCFAPSGAYYFSAELPAMLRKEKFDVVHAHNYHGLPFHIAGLFARCDKFIVSPCFHGAGHTTFRDCLFKIFKPFGKRTLKRADHILAASEFEKSLLCRFFDFRPDDIVVIPRGVDFSEFKGLKRKRHHSKSILFVGRLVEYKGVQFLVEALPKLPKDVILKIVGKGPLRSRLEARAKHLGVYDRIRFYQNLERKELLQMYADSDVFVLPSRYEAYSKVVAEALMAGIPCIVANTSALKEWVDNESCFGIDYPINVRELAELIDAVMQKLVDKEITHKWVGIKIIDWNNVVCRLEKIYRM
ncbi:MAG: glycosyltransferase family 4 protein [Nitrososphaerota archaeon]